MDTTWFRAKAVRVHEIVERHRLLMIAAIVVDTEIDWTTYMQQIELVVRGERNYMNIEGDTGPIVYPAGYVWIYSALYLLTNAGKNLHLAQYIFAGLYCATLLIVLLIYHKCNIPAITYPLLCVSKRIHSIYVLRLFNDPFAMFFAFAAFLSMLNRRSLISAILLSFAISVKMNVLLYVPAWLYQLAMQNGPGGFAFHISLLLAVQAAVAMPFLMHDAKAYLARAFELSRVFMFKWTVNWRFVPAAWFVAPVFGNALLAVWLGSVLAILVLWAWRYHGGTAQALRRWSRGLAGAASPLGKGDMTTNAAPLEARRWMSLYFVVHLVGIITARSLHYQFYSWYFFTLPFLVQETRYPWALRLILLVSIEICWLTFPSAIWSSLLLLSSHIVLLVGVLFLHFGKRSQASKKVKVS